MRFENRGGNLERLIVAAMSDFAADWRSARQRQEKMSADGLITLRSSNGPEETMNRFEAEVRKRGLTIFAHVDHAAGAAAAGLPLRSTELLVFGNARGGTPLMQADQTIGIDLPLKALAWKDASGKTWLSYNDAVWLAARHGITGHGAQVAAALTSAVAGLAKDAAGA